MAKKSCLVVGLGNPGAHYSNSRHNIGYLFVDELTARWNITLTQEKWDGVYSSFSLSGVKVYFVKPLTFMNLSGRSIVQYFRFFKIDPSKLLVIHDDLDMDTGRIKLVKGGGAGGHNGIKSIIDSLGTKDFFRLKIGIGRPGKGDVHPDFPVEQYVLSSLDNNDHDILQSRYDAVEKGVRSFLLDGADKAMNLLNCLK